MQKSPDFLYEILILNISSQVYINLQCAVNFKCIFNCLVLYITSIADLTLSSLKFLQVQMSPWAPFLISSLWVTGRTPAKQYTACNGEAEV